MSHLASEVVELLRQRGIEITRQGIWYHVSKGNVDTPDKVGRVYIFKRKHVSQLERAIRNPRKRGRKPRLKKETG
ncbi:hypothetical protein LCGC14_2373190 [marine sediment metagenome]|uniref:Uncharacterized protein n=1 Tax=marine sediment metagenome TaxID=412755 RepID=A0A0F9CQD4_9ZZZZ